MKPSQTLTKTYRQNLDEMEFPVIFRICSVPGFNLSAVEKVGYHGADFLMGKVASMDPSLAGVATLRIWAV